MEQQRAINSFAAGIRDGMPIGLGYIPVSFAFGIMVVASGLPIWVGVVMSMTNLTSAGQFAGLSIIATGASFAEMALTQLVINMRYALMSLSLSQKLDKQVSLIDRLLISFCNTDEVFAVASSKRGELGKRYLYGLICAPFICWVLGTLMGAVASDILPAAVSSALGIALYGMFIAIIIPPVRYYRPILWVLLVAVAISCIFYWTPGLNEISSGFVIIICAVAASLVGALLFPLKEGNKVG